MVVLFIMVVVIFFFAQADTNKMERMYLNNMPPVTASLDDNQNPESETGSAGIKPIIPVIHFR